MTERPIFEPPHTLLVATEGWSDAGEAATSALRMVVEHFGLVPYEVISDEAYFDYQVTRPFVQIESDGSRVISWPDITLFGPDRHEGDGEGPFVILGAEPSRMWRQLADQMVLQALSQDVDQMVLCGAMLADVPHSRPVRMLSSSEDQEIREALDVERSSYEGPVGILSVLGLQAQESGIAVMNLWAQVPHYVHTSPSPKATLAILDRLHELTGIDIPRGSLLEQAEVWEENIDSLAAEDDDMLAYIHQLEKQRDTVESPEASGDAIAKEFERYLNKRPDWPGGVAGGEG
ncbi:ATP-dependent carboligase [Pontimonas salivibrio]|uniref:ATP-dependent carboligase n=1 Tax=Pontimonas salivibrio TaxID=1159327 RepID=A0A2L2BQP8_9MICO|nr:PAC2 family protein [Pontimonas salivibrio]AVG23991.1 ATP-dependent carboligase [Pontimonas salivibrio]